MLICMLNNVLWTVDCLKFLVESINPSVKTITICDHIFEATKYHQFNHFWKQFALHMLIRLLDLQNDLADDVDIDI